MMRQRMALALVLAALSSIGTNRAAAQGRFGDEETRLVREAAERESAGDLDGAEAALRRLLEIDPVSTGGIYGLERVLRAKDEVEELLPLVDRFLSRRDDSGVRSLRLQLLVETGQVEQMVSEGRRWMERSPRDETVYTEVARAYEAAFGPERALEVLEAGRERMGGDALALAMGDYHAARGDLDAAVDEWVKAVAADESSVQAVRRRVASLAEGETEAGRRLVRALGDSPLSRNRRLATRLAIELGLGPEALALARTEAATLVGRAKTQYLEELSIAATAAGVAEVASWAYTELGRTEEDPADRRQLEQRRAEASLASGDTLAALDSFDRVALSLPAGSAERRPVEARAIRVSAASSHMDRLRAYWDSFRSDYPMAPELDELGATTSAALIAWGDIEGAVHVLDGLEGPRSTIERAYLLLGGGEVAAGQGALMAAVPGLPPSEATEIIQLAGLLGRVSPAGAQALAKAGVQAHLGRGGAAAITLADEAFNLPGPDQPMVLAEAARMADRASSGPAAAEIRQRLVQEYPDAPEAGEATLALARHLSREQGNSEEAIRILEDLITRQPNAAVVPEARLELERLRSRGS